MFPRLDPNEALRMNSDSDRFLLPKEQRLSWGFLARRSRCARLPGMAKTARRYFFFWARNGIYHCLRALGLSPGDRVLAPAYVCAAAVEPLAAYGAEVVFYQIHRDCTPDFSDLEAKSDARTRAVLAVHYFGFPQGIRQFRDLCDRRRMALIEDCAHVLQGESDGRPLGSFGEASVFSWAKFLPVYDGGELILNRWQQELEVDWLRESPLFTLKVAKNLVDQLLRDARRPLFRIPGHGLRASRSAVLRLAGVSEHEAQALAVDGNSDSFDRGMLNFPMSRLSRMILAHSDFTGIAAKRRKNYLYLLEKLSGVRGLRMLFPELPAGVCPWVFPVFFEGLPNAHLPLRQMGIPAVTWGGVRYPGISKDVFPDADFLYENLVFLPIHQGLKEKELEIIVAGVRAVRQESPAEVSVVPFA